MVHDMEMTVDIQPDPSPAVSLGTILIMEDDPRMQKVLRRIFTEERYNAVVAGDGQTGLELFRREQPLAVVLDLILPNISGRELCQTFKSASSETPIIVLSAITEVADKVLLLELGADDYVTKPFSPRELTARVQAAIRRQRKPARPRNISLRRLRSRLQKNDRPARREACCSHCSRVQAPEVFHRKCRARADARCPAE